MMEQKPKRKNQPKANKWKIVLLLWIFISLCWNIASNFSYAFDAPRDLHYYSGSAMISRELETHSYWEFIQSHTWHSTIVLHPTFSLLVSIGVGCFLLYKAKAQSLMLLLSFLVCFLFFCNGMTVLWTSMISHWTELTHVDTVNSDNYVYHLTHAQDGGNDVYPEEWLALFVCDSAKGICHGLPTQYGTFDNASLNSRLRLTIQDNRLHILADDLIVESYEEQCLQIRPPFEINFIREVVNCERMR